MRTLAWALTTFFFRVPFGGPITGQRKATAAAKRPPRVGAPRRVWPPQGSASGGHHAYGVNLGVGGINPWPGE
jgi:hypothetical protein